MPPTPLTRTRLRALADARAESGRVVSVYLNLDPTHFATPPARATAITSLCNHLEGKVADLALGHDERRKLDEAVALIKAELQRGDIAEGGTQALAVFANSEDGMLESIRLPHPVDSRVEVNTSAYVEPLVAAGSQERWLILLANRSKARFFVGPADGLVETDQLDDDVHRQHSQGGWSQARYQRGVDEEVRDHLKHTADIAFQIFKRRPFDHVLVAAPEETVGDVEQALHPYLQQRLAGRLQVDIGASSEKDVQTAASAAIAAHRVAQEREVLDRIAEHVGRGERGAAGLDAVLDALNQARVEILVVLENLQAAGFRDPATEMLAGENGTSPTGGAMEPVDNIIDEAMQKAVETNAEIIVVREHREEIEEHGGIAALLRF
jgi:peptide chain release factor subunit 1